MVMRLTDKELRYNGDTLVDEKAANFDSYDFESEQTLAGKYFVSPSSSITDHGLDVDGSLKSLIDKIGANSGVIELPPNTTYNFSVDITVPSNITLRFNQGAVIHSSNSSADLVINGTLEAGLYQIFSGDGPVTLGSSIRFYEPVWFNNTTQPPIANTFPVGIITFNLSSAVGQPVGWICTVAGTPGTWTPMVNL